MSRRLRDDYQEFTDDETLIERTERELDREFAAPYLRNGSIEPWPMWPTSAPEYMTGVLGPVVPMDDEIRLVQAMFDRSKGPDCLANKRQRSMAAKRAKRREFLREWRVAHGFSPNSHKQPKPRGKRRSM